MYFVSGHPPPSQSSERLLCKVKSSAPWEVEVSLATDLGMGLPLVPFLVLAFGPVHSHCSIVKWNWI